MAGASAYRDRLTGRLCEEYRVDGRLHRDPAEGPAFIERDTGRGIVVREEYRVHGKLHRDPAAGPALIWHHLKTGIVTWQGYWVNGKRVVTPARR